MFYLTTHSTHFIYGYMASDIWLRTILIVRKETRCCHIGYSYWLTARVLLYAPSHRQDNTHHSLCYTSRGALAGTRNSSMGPPWANALPLSYVPLLSILINYAQKLTLLQQFTVLFPIRGALMCSATDQVNFTTAIHCIISPIRGALMWFRHWSS